MKKDYYKFFERKERSTDEFIFILSDRAPKDLIEFVRKLHVDCFTITPNDWVYGVLYEAFTALHEDDRDNVYIQADCYNWQLIEWLKNGYSDEYCTLSMVEFGPHETFMNLVSFGQYLAKREVYDAVNQFINS